MRRILHALLHWCRQRPGLALVPFLFCLYGPGLLLGASFPAPAGFSELRWLAPAGQAPAPLELFSAAELLNFSRATASFAQGLLSLLFLAAVIVAARLALRYSCDLGERCTSWVAMMTLFIYTSTSTAAGTVLYSDQRSILLSACFSWLSLASLAASTRSRNAIHTLLSPLCLAIALWGGLEGLCGGAFVLAYAVWGDPRPKLVRARAALPHALMCIAALLLFFNATPADPSGVCGTSGLAGRFARLCAELLAWLPPQAAQCAEPRTFVVLLGLASLALAVVVLPWILRTASPNHVRTLRWTGAGAILSLLPALLVPADGRYLLCASLGASFFFASALRRCGQAMRAQRVFAVLLALGALRHFVLAPVHTFLFSLFLAVYGAPTDPVQNPPAAHSTSGARTENAYLAASGNPAHAHFSTGTGYGGRHAEPRSVIIPPRPYPRRRR